MKNQSNKIVRLLGVIVFFVLISISVKVDIASADTVYSGNSTTTPRGQIFIGTGSPVSHVYGLQFYNGATEGNVSEVDFFLNAVNGDRGDRLYAGIWSYANGIITQIATSTNFVTGDAYDGNPNHPTYTPFAFSPLVRLEPNRAYLIGVRQINNVASTSFVMYGNNDPMLMPTQDFANCSKNSGVELEITGALAYITDGGAVGWKSCGYLVVGNVIGKSSPKGLAVFNTQGIINRGFEGYARPRTVGYALVGTGSTSEPFNTHDATGAWTAGQSGTPTADSDNPNSSSFRLTVCDGPRLPESVTGPIKSDADFYAQYGVHQADYVACDFKGVMLQVNKLISVALISGVFVAIAGFCYIGYLFISGKEDNRKLAYSIFPKIFWGFIIMLSAWFIVSQVISWLGANPAATSLLNGK